MKASLFAIMTVGVAALLGCNYGILLRLRPQLRSPDEYFRITPEGEYLLVQFNEPTIRDSDVADLGFPHVRPGTEECQLPYVLRMEGCADRPVFAVLGFTSDGFLRSLRVPVVLYRTLGRQNILEILKLAGGTASEQIAFEPIPESRLQDLLVHEGGSPDAIKNEMRISLAPGEAGARVLTLTLSRRSRGDAYNNARISFKRGKN